MMATYSGYNAMQGWGTGQPATPPGMNSQQQQVNYNARNSGGGHDPKSDNPQLPMPIWTTGGIQQTGSTSTDAIKQPSKGSNLS